MKIKKSYLIVAITFYLLSACDNTSTSNNTSNQDWVLIQGGTFTMNHLQNIDPEKNPEATQLQEKISDLYIMKAETTVKQYRECVADKICWETLITDNLDCNYKQTDKENHPINCVDWYQASAYCTWADSRLPFEAEWEYIATNKGKKILYPWGNNPTNCELANMQTGEDPSCQQQQTHEVCSHPKGNTESGVCDLIGNVTEWVRDWYYEDYLFPTGYRNTPKFQNINNNEFSFHRTVRGQGDSTSQSRTHYEPNFYHTSVGFRCIRNSDNNSHKTNYEKQVLSNPLPVKRNIKRPSEDELIESRRLEKERERASNKRSLKSTNMVISGSQVSNKDATGSAWNHTTNVIIPADGVTIHYNSLVKSKTIDISLDNNDLYKFEFYLDEKSLGSITFPKKYNPEGGLSQHREQLPKSVQEQGFNRIIIRPSGGDQYYSLGHIIYR